MSVAIMQPYFFPYLGYWQLVNYVDTFVVLDDVNYINRGWIDRNRIIINDKEHFLKLPLEGKSQNKYIKEINIKAGDCEKKKLTKTVHMSYRKRPYYDEIMPLIEKMLNQDEMNLARYLKNMIEQMNEFLNIDTKLIFSSEFKLDKSGLAGQDRIIEICKRLKEEEYINPIGGVMLYDKETFKNNNIELFFLKMDNVKYEQGNSNFIPGLSIIDVLMNNGKKGMGELLKLYSLE